MDERNIRTGRTTDVNNNVEQDVDIRRTMIMGRDLDYTGTPRVLATAPVNRVLHWGPIMAGFITTMVSSLLLGALALGLGFDRNFGVYGGLNSSELGWGSVIVGLISVFIGAYLTGFVSDLRSKAEGTYNGFMVGATSIFAPILLAAFGAYGAANTAVNAASNTVARTTNPDATANVIANNTQVPQTVTNSVQNALTIAADNAWMVFLGGLLILGVATLAGYLGAKSREKSIEAMVKRDIEHGKAVV
jgi:hypothetical protein